MYGGIWAYREGTNDNPYYLAAKNAISPLSASFDFVYFSSLRNEKTGKLSLKAFLATEQRIPGLGNGVLQDILFFARLHPKRKLNTLTEEEFQTLYQSVKAVIAQMTDGGGRDTERDLYGNSGGYMTYLSKKTVWTPCPVCGYELHKGNYMGGTIYYCEKCQK
jgi:formamidopyrimidine-DNA glycosylase